MRNDRVSLNLKKTARTDVNQSERFVFHVKQGARRAISQKFLIPNLLLAPHSSSASRQPLPTNNYLFHVEGVKVRISG